MASISIVPYPVWDAAKRLTSGMYIPGSQVSSFHIKKHLKIGKGGMILTDSKDLVDWVREARYEGRSEGVRYQEDDIDSMGWNMYMTPEQAVRGLMLMQNYPEHMPDIPEDPPYRDLTEFKLFKEKKMKAPKLFHINYLIHFPWQEKLLSI